MRRRPVIRGASSTRQPDVPVNANPDAISGSVTLFCDRDSSVLANSECSAGASRLRALAERQELLHRALQGAIEQVTERFEEAQYEYRLVTSNSRDGYKWKGEMIAYANVVALLEDLKSHSVLAE